MLHALAKKCNGWVKDAQKKRKTRPKMHMKFIQVLDFVLWALTTESN